MKNKIIIFNLQISISFLKNTIRTYSCLPPFILWKAEKDPPVISPYLACINEMTIAALCAPWNFYFLISFYVIAALAVPWLGDIIIVITTSSSSCRQIILPGSFSPPSLQLHRGGEITFFTKPFCCLYCDSGHTPSHSPSLRYEYPTIGVMVKEKKKFRAEETAYLPRGPIPPLACE